MALEPFLLDLLEDPIDHQPLWYVASREALLNPRRLVSFPIRDGIPVLLPDEAQPVDATEAQTWSSDPTGRWTGSNN